MNKIFSLFFVFLVFVYAGEVEPSVILKTSGGVTDMVVKEDKLYAATSASSVDIFDIKTKNRIKSIQVSHIKDFMGDEINSKIYSVDVLGDKILILSQDNGGYRRVHLFEDNKLTEVVSKGDRLYIAKAKFIDKNHILLGLLSNVLINYEISSKKHIWEFQATESKFSNFVLNKTRTQAISTDESGDLHMIDLKKGKVIKSFTGQNVDNVFQVDWKKDVVATAGQDRRCAVFNAKTANGYYKTASFLIYSVGISPDGKLIGYANTENNDVTIFNSQSKEDIAVLTKNKTNISDIKFLNDREVFVSCDTNEINYYKF